MRLRQGVTADQAITQLNELIRLLQGPRNAPDEPVASNSRPDVPLSVKINAYLLWVEQADAHAQVLFADRDFIDGLYRERHWHILGLPPRSAYGTRLVGNETDHQEKRLTDMVETLKTWKQLGDRPGELLALDTNTFLQFRLYDEIPWTTLCGSKTVRLILSMPVLDELEAKKQGSNERLKKRARKVLPLVDKAIDAALGDGDDLAVPVVRSGKPVAGVTFEILRDPAGHHRTSDDMDAEFLDRCTFLQQATGRAVTVVTGDTGMKIRARGQSAQFKLLTIPETYRLTGGEEPVIPT